MRENFYVQCIFEELMLAVIVELVFVKIVRSWDEVGEAILHGFILVKLRYLKAVVPEQLFDFLPCYLYFHHMILFDAVFVFPQLI